jgi:hypothetical protein
MKLIQQTVGILGGGRGGREVLMELLRSWQLSRKKREGGLYWPGPQQLPVHRSQRKFIFPIGHISFRIRLDLMLKLIRNYINPDGFAVLLLLQHMVCIESFLPICLDNFIG